MILLAFSALGVFLFVWCFVFLFTLDKIIIDFENIYFY